MNDSIMDSIKKEILKQKRFQPKKITIKFDELDSFLTQRNPDYDQGRMLSCSDCQKCALDIAQLVYLEYLKGG